MVAIGTLAVAFLASYGATYQLAAKRVFYPQKGSHVVIERANVVGRYAAVLTRGGVMEGSSVIEPILVEHFSFGWQALEILTFRCDLEVHVVSARDEVLLLRRMPRPQDRPCRDRVKDVGPKAQVEAVRRQMRGPLVPSVVVWGNYALGHWYGSGGGESLYENRAGHWRVIASGGGAMGVQELRQYGVPRAAWCTLMAYGPTCSHKRG